MILTSGSGNGLSQGWHHFLCCPNCYSKPQKEGAGFRCQSCGCFYSYSGGVIFFSPTISSDFVGNEGRGKNSDGIILKLKDWAKRKPVIFKILYHWAGAFIGISAKKAIGSLNKSKLILNLGSGAKMIRPGVLNVDRYPFVGVALVADILALPFQSGSVDAVIAESVLEHVPDSLKVVQEISRVLKPGGLLYMVTPFMLGYHASPNDYYRWTEFGMSILLQDFEIRQSGPAWGPTAALLSMVGNWLAIVLSFGSSRLYQVCLAFFILLFGPLTYVDFLIAKHSRAADYSHGLYFIAIKKGN